MRIRLLGTGFPALIAFIAAAPSYAHTGVLQTTGFWHGLEHPLTGMDHLLAMVAVGIWAAQLGGRALWLVPITFITVMSISGIASMGGIAPPLVEPGIVLSVLLLGILITAMVRLPVTIGASLVGVFAAFHGAAHGIEVPAQASGAAYAVGFVTATAVLHLCGLGLAGLLARFGRLDLVRYLGGVVTLGGAYLTLT